MEEKVYKIRTDKNNEMDLFLRNINNEELSITINKNKSIKYELICDLEEFQKNRFFKIFFNVEEIKKELENKIEKSTFIEENNSIIIDIPIGLTIINEVLLVIEEKEKNKDEIIKELLENNNKLEKKVEELKNDLSVKNKQLEKEIEKFRILKEKEEKAKKEEDELFENDNKLEKKIEELKKILKDKKLKEEEEKAIKEESKLKSYLLVI